MRTLFKVALIKATLLLPSIAHSDIIASPASPPLDQTFCAGMEQWNPSKWSGEMPAWGGSSRPMIQVELDNGAVCNDGTPAVMYVRQARATLSNGTPNPLIDMYHIHMKGGGSCHSFAACQQRWCGTGPKFTDKPGLMSSRGYAPAIEGTGIFRERPSNQIGFANQVMVAYCSSDTWMGSAPAGTAVSIDPNDDPAAVSNIAFMGHEIIVEAINALSIGLTAQSPTGDIQYTMPPMSNVAKILITGDSAGANGARTHLDTIASGFPQATTVAALDAGASIDLQDPRIDYTLHPTATSYSTMMDERTVQARSFHNVLDDALDQSCLAANPGGGAAENPCFNGYELQRDHITTPTLQRTSQADITAKNGFSSLLVPPTVQTLRQLAYDGMLAATAARANLSGLSPICTEHVTFRSNRQYGNMRVLAPGLRLGEDVQNWVMGCFAGACPKVVKLAAPTVAGGSVCP